ncbi:hypothetical protein SMD44_05106 [Streptomyces alboflavus]|uniref:Uncharacterized protein n=1 Tax=Streptomyces alboflavus TaxID=67267 RepID=A0A1Z1WH37_9ACTN|nr:hypothetical protein [Streptomyces alboflavus]ARX85642.1 hypothetical protein SMD44_05106 [Streptomyces alboflavus]
MELTRYAIRRTGTPHYGAPNASGMPVMLCGTRSDEFESFAWAEAIARMCQQCERAAAVLAAGDAEPELRLAAGAITASGAGHMLIADSVRAYCGRQLGEDVASSGRVCKNCTSVRAALDAFLAEAELTDPVEAVTGAEAADGTWRGAWIGTAPEKGQQLTLDGAGPDAEQGALFS